MEEYKEENNKYFKPHTSREGLKASDISLLTKIQKAAAIIQFKLEKQIIDRNPLFNMQDRLLLDKINFKTGEIKIDNQTYKLTDTYFPTINKENIYELSPKEKEVVEKIKKCFLNSEKLQRHVQFLYNKGSLYKIYNDNLLIHGCIPMNDKGELVSVNVGDKILFRKRIFRLFRKNGKARILCGGRNRRKNKRKRLFMVLVVWRKFSNIL